MSTLNPALTAQMINAIAAGDFDVLANVLAQQLRGAQSSAATAVSYPGSGTAYTNNTSFLQTVTISGGTVTVITLSRGGVTGLTSGQFLLAPGDSITCTSSGNPTVFNVTNMI